MCCVCVIDSRREWGEEFLGALILFFFHEVLNGVLTFGRNKLNIAQDCMKRERGVSGRLLYQLLVNDCMENVHFMGKSVPVSIRKHYICV